MEVKVTELRQVYESNREVRNTVKKANMDEYARAESSMNSSSNSAFFGWCTSFRGTNAAEERAHHYELRWDAGERRVQHHSSDVLPWDTEGRCEAVTGHGHHVDLPYYDEGDDELLQWEVPSPGDVIVGQVPPPKDKAEHTEQEIDIHVPVLMGGALEEQECDYPVPVCLGGGGHSQKSSSQQWLRTFSAPDLNQSDLWQLDTP